MTKVEWMKHREEMLEGGMTIPEFELHTKDCPICAARRKTRRQNFNRRMYNAGISAVYDSCGMKRVKGNLGGTYWE